MVYLDCQNLDTALASFAAACNRSVDAVAEAIRSHPADWDEYEPQLEEAGLPQMLDHLGLAGTDVTFDGAFYFHGTRVFDPGTFAREGILPLGQIIDRIWASLHVLVADTVSDRQWRGLRADLEAGLGRGGIQYRNKTPNPRLHGPYAHLARQHHLPHDGHHDYLAIPEIVEDIARTCELVLAQRFQAATTPCVVKFHADHMNSEILQAGFWYVHGMLHHGSPGELARCHYNGNGNAVPALDVVSVEIIEN